MPLPIASGIAARRAFAAAPLIDSLFLALSGLA